MKYGFLTPVLACLLTNLTPYAWAHSDADPIVSMLSFKQFEQSKIGDDTAAIWNVDAWIGKDYDKLWIKTNGEFAHGQRQDSSIEVLYSRAVATYWDIQTGWRGDFNDTENRQWFAFGLQGLTPYFFETELTFYLGEHGQTALKIDTEYELLFTQKLILSPELEVNIHGRNDRQTGTGGGLSDIEAGLRLRYEFTRKFAPYIGVNYHKKYGQTAEYSRDSGTDTETMSWLIGLRFWF
ncbi:copper resistance protein B [Zhongshania sp. BJYM1]|uniref:copper resistance protein B n=1 Tax=Zhongshania aquatica TaxID=2965069 RepID=UPI0022B479DF|nr:copper resistance protein B [Marortus sp. BJYM1]